MREEIEAAALFITRLVNKNLSQVSSGSAACSSASSIHSNSSSAESSSSSSTSSDSPPDFDDQLTTTTNGQQQQQQQQIKPTTDLVEQFRQCLTEALYERFYNHWFPDQPTKGQAYRCIRLNEWDRRDITLQKACSQCGIDYKDLQLPVELTLWVDPEEVTCRFGENKGSHCLVARFKDGELKDNNFNIDINNIDIEIFRQAANERIRQPSSLHGSPDYKLHNRSLNNINGSIIHNNSYHNMNHNNSHQQQQQQHHQQTHNHHHHQSNQHHQQAQQLSSPQHHHHRAAALGKAAILSSYTQQQHHNYLTGCDSNGNPFSYYPF